MCPSVCAIVSARFFVGELKLDTLHIFHICHRRMVVEVKCPAAELCEWLSACATNALTVLVLTNLDNHKVCAAAVERVQRRDIPYLQGLH